MKHNENPEVENTMVLNIQHLDPNTLNQLNEGIHFGIADVMDYEYGYLFFTAAIEASIAEGEAVPVCLQNIAERAKQNKCAAVMLDYDGVSVADLQEWEQ